MMNNFKKYIGSGMAMTAAFTFGFGSVACSSLKSDYPQRIPVKKLEKDIKIDKNAVQKADEPEVSPYDNPYVPQYYPQFFLPFLGYQTFSDPQRVAQHCQTIRLIKKYQNHHERS